MKSLRQAVLPIFGILLMVNIAFTYFNRPQKIVYVVGKKVFEEFTMTREVQKHAQAEAQARQQHLDSLFTLLKTAATTQAKQQLQIAIAEEKQYLDNFEVAFSSSETPKVWSRISDYAKDFAEKNACDFILGARPGGDVIYGNPDVDVTDDFIKYINQRYEGN